MEETGMIGDGRFEAQLAIVGNLLKKLGRLEDRVPVPNKTLGAAHFKGLSYRQVYEECVREYAYDFRLTDQSLLLFVKGGQNIHDGSLSYCYYECPVPAMSYREFVAMEAELPKSGEEFEQELELWGDELRPDYEQYLTSLEAKRIVTPIRYDYKASDYREGVHPASHVHFGFANEIRVATHRVMNPVSFALLVIRQCYPKTWEALLAVRAGPILCRNVRDKIEAVDAAYFKGRDSLELALQ
jgi:hypothetical protein